MRQLQSYALVLDLARAAFEEIFFSLFTCVIKEDKVKLQMQSKKNNKSHAPSPLTYLNYIPSIFYYKMFNIIEIVPSTCMYLHSINTISFYKISRSSSISYICNHP